MLRACWAALAFLTPVGRATPPQPSTVPAMPVVGAVIGLGVGGVWWLADEIFPALVAAVIVVAADAALTGLLHLDGLSDSADGLLAPMERERRLAVMRDPAVGAFGAVTLVVVLATRATVFATATVAPLTIGALWCLSRTAMAAVTCTVRYARTDGGLASSFLADARAAGDRPRHRRRLVATVAIGLAIATPLALVGSGGRGLVALGCLAVAAVAVVGFAHRRIGGFTGDVLGAAGVIGETIGLLALVAR